MELVSPSRPACTLLPCPYFAKFGNQGGKTRAKNMTPEQRQEAARKAVQARWAQQKKQIESSVQEIREGTAALLRAPGCAHEQGQEEAKSSPETMSAPSRAFPFCFGCHARLKQKSSVALRPMA